MSLFAGMVSFNTLPEHKTLPYNGNIYTSDNVSFTRKDGQPLCLRREDEEYALIFDGEIYNKDEVIAELKVVDDAKTDIGYDELVLRAYAHWQGECLHKLNGAFAFAVWEKHRNRLFLARDRMGVKPLYFTVRNDSLIFASELKSILGVAGMLAELDLDGIAELALLSPGRTPGKALLRGMEELCPGECVYFSREYAIQKHKYWNLIARKHRENDNETAEHVRFLLEDSIKRCCDAPLNTCAAEEGKTASIATMLSGGLDSSVISSVADILLTSRGQRLKTFSVSYKDQAKYFKSTFFQPNADDEYIRRMNRYLGAEHYEILLDSSDLAHALNAALDARELPGMADVDSSLLLFCRKISEYTDIALSGEVSDEIFAGYPWYRENLSPSYAALPWAKSTDYRFSFLREEWREKIDPKAVISEQYNSVVQDTDTLPEAALEHRKLQEMVKLHCDLFMQTLTTRNNAMSIAGGLTVRAPYCDYRLAEYLYNVPWEIKHQGGQEKGLLRTAMAGYLPREVRERKKSPYPKTHNPAYLALVRDMLREILDDSAAPLFSLFDPASLELLLREEGREQPWYGQLMTTPQTIAWFLQVNYWLKKYRVRVS